MASLSSFNKNELELFPLELARDPRAVIQAGGCNQSSLKYTCGKSKLWLALTSISCNLHTFMLSLHVILLVSICQEGQQLVSPSSVFMHSDASLVPRPSRPSVCRLQC